MMPSQSLKNQTTEPLYYIYLFTYWQYSSVTLDPYFEIISDFLY